MTRPALAASIAHYQQLAQAQLPTAIWQHLQQGRDNLTGRANRQAFDNTLLMPRPLQDMRQAHTGINLWGESLAHPIILAPIAYQRLYHAEGEIASAMAAHSQDGQIILSSLASQHFANINRAAQQQTWLQLYWQGDRAKTLALLQRGLDSGCKAVFFTVDAPVKPALNALDRPDVLAVNIETPTQNMTIQAPTSTVFNTWMSQAPTWEDVAWLREQVSVPLVIKGILHPDDAQQAVALGCDGVVVSNHGGRVLNGSPAALTMLPQMIAATANKIPILLDSGIDSGFDVYRALSLGASAVLVGRPYIWGLSVAGAYGVAHVLRLMRDELEMAIALCGAPQS